MRMCASRGDSFGEGLRLSAAVARCRSCWCESAEIETVEGSGAEYVGTDRCERAGWDDDDGESERDLSGGLGGWFEGFEGGEEITAGR